MQVSRTPIDHHFAAQYQSNDDRRRTRQPDFANLGIFVEDGETGEYQSKHHQRQRHESIRDQVQFVAVESMTEETPHQSEGVDGRRPGTGRPVRKRTKLAYSERATTTTTTLAPKKPINQCALEYELALVRTAVTNGPSPDYVVGDNCAARRREENFSNVFVVRRSVVTSDRRP